MSKLESFHDFAPELEDFAEAVIDGLGRPEKTLPCKFFYDQAGSQLFDRICRLEEYYLTRTEIAILKAHAAEISGLIGSGCKLVEFGSGSSLKIRILLDALDAPAAYMPVDISREHLLASAETLAENYPSIPVIAVCTDYTRPFELPDLPSDSAPGRNKSVVFFPGSSVGNFSPNQATEFLTGTAEMLRGGGGLLIGVDLKKDKQILEAAYNDRQGVTASFNLNLIARINRELGADFEISKFEHNAFYDSNAGRIEMHLVSRRRQSVNVNGQAFQFEADETIHTENSQKYTVAEFQELGRRAGFSPLAVWTDPDGLFSIHFMRAEDSSATL